MEDKDIAKIELDSLDNSEAVLKDSIIIEFHESNYKMEQARVIMISDTSLTIPDIIMSVMIGIYALKDYYSSVEVNVYGVKRYTFELNKYAVPSKKDLVKIFMAISDAFKTITNNNLDIIDVLENVLVDIQQDKIKFEE